MVDTTAINHADPKVLVSLEEYKLVSEQAQFVMTRYIQALGLYLTFVGFGINAVLGSAVLIRTWIIVFALTCGNVLAFYSATHFRKMAYHALDRQEELARELAFQAPYPMMWGYRVGIVAFGGVQLGLVAVVVRTVWIAAVSTTP